MKKALPKILFIVVLVGVILGGKKLIEFKTEDYRETVTTSLTEFFISGDTSKLEPIIEILEKYEDDDEKRKEIQDYSLDIVGSWYLYLDNKYYCDNKNLNSCKAQLEEFNTLNDKLNKLYETKCEDGFTIIIPSSYTNLKNQGDVKVAGLQKIIDLPSATNPQDSETIRKTKCATATDCSSCKSNICSCYYTDENNNRETVSCYVANTK